MWLVVRRRCVRTAAWCVTAAVVALLAVSVVVPRIAGATPYTILTGSMEPGLPPGTLVVVRPVDAQDIDIGSVITYQIASGEPTVVTHRVVAQGLRSDGTPVFRTQGDANPVPDEAWVRPVQVRGESWYAIPYVGRITTLVAGGPRQTVLHLVVVGLLAYAATMIGSAVRDRRVGRRHPAGAAS